MKKIILAGLVTWLLIFGVAGIACATLVDWTLTFNSDIGVSGNVADFEYVFAIDTEVAGIRTYEPTSTAQGIYPFYSEYVSKNGLEKGFDYLPFGSEDSYPYDWNLAMYYSPTHLHLEMYENSNNALYLNIFFSSTDFGSDLSQATSLSIRDVDGGVNYAASNILADHFTLIKSAPVPEPATMLLFGFGLLGLAGVSRRKK